MSQLVRTLTDRRVVVAVGEQLKVVRTSTERRVVVALAGIRGPGGSGPSHTHTQAVAQSSWTVVHNLGRHPLVDVEVSNEAVQARVTYPNNTSALVEFTSPQIGKAYCY